MVMFKIIWNGEKIDKKKSEIFLPPQIFEKKFLTNFWKKISDKFFFRPKCFSDQIFFQTKFLSDQTKISDQPPIVFIVF